MLNENVLCRHMGTVNCKIRAALAALKHNEASAGEGGIDDASASMLDRSNNAAQPANQEGVARQNPEIVILPGVPFKEREAISKWPTSDSRKIWNEEMDFPAEWKEIVDGSDSEKKSASVVVVK
jgi:hypothetical protein